MRLKLGTKIDLSESYVRLHFPVILRRFHVISAIKKTRDGPRMDGRADGRTDPCIEMRGRI